MLTGGGDVPSLNPCIKAIVTRAEELGWETVGFRRGWAGPLHVDPADEDSVRDHVMDLTTTTVRGIDRTGGTLLHTSRTNPGRVACEDLPRTYPSRCGPSTDRKPAGPSTAPITCSTFWKGCGSTLSSPSAATTRCPMRRAYIGKV